MNLNSNWTESILSVVTDFIPTYPQIMEGMPRSERQETDRLDWCNEMVLFVFIISITLTLTASEPAVLASHWNSKDGCGSFNWRMKFPLLLPYPNPRLKIQIWDKDIVSSDDMICEAILNLSRSVWLVWSGLHAINLKPKTKEKKRHELICCASSVADTQIFQACLQDR